MLVVCLSGFDPRSALIKKPLGYSTIGRDSSIKELMFIGTVGELPRTVALLPAPCAEGVRVQHAEPMELIARIQAQPVQPLALLATHMGGRVESIGHLHIRPTFGNHRHVETLPESALHVLVDISHVAHDDVRREIQHAGAIMHARFYKQALSARGGRGPGDEWRQHNPVRDLRQPQTQRVFFVTDEPTALT